MCHRGIFWCFCLGVEVKSSVERCVGAIRLLIMRLCVSGLFATSPVGNLRDPQTRVAILPFSLGASPIGVVAFLLLRGVAIDADGRRASSCMGRRITCGRGARYRSVERRVTVLSLGTFQKLLHLEPAFDLGPYTFDYLHISCVLTQYLFCISICFP